MSQLGRLLILFNSWIYPLFQELLKSRKLKEEETGSKEEQVEERSAAKKVSKQIRHRDIRTLTILEKPHLMLGSHIYIPMKYINKDFFLKLLNTKYLEKNRFQ